MGYNLLCDRFIVKWNEWRLLDQVAKPGQKRANRKESPRNIRGNRCDRMSCHGDNYPKDIDHSHEIAPAEWLG